MSRSYTSSPPRRVAGQLYFLQTSTVLTNLHGLLILEDNKRRIKHERKVIIIGKKKITHVLFADEYVLFSEIEDGLQINLHLLNVIGF
jgi:hypothetical protein